MRLSCETLHDMKFCIWRYDMPSIAILLFSVDGRVDGFIFGHRF
jgi:hypothetical protein